MRASIEQLWNAFRPINWAKSSLTFEVFYPIRGPKVTVAPFIHFVSVESPKSKRFNWNRNYMPFWNNPIGLARALVCTQMSRLLMEIRSPIALNIKNRLNFINVASNTASYANVKDWHKQCVRLLASQCTLSHLPKGPLCDIMHLIVVCLSGTVMFAIYICASHLSFTSFARRPLSHSPFIFFFVRLLLSVVVVENNRMALPLFDHDFTLIECTLFVVVYNARSLNAA